MGKTTSVVDYQVLLDGDITLDASTNLREANFEFTVPTDFVISGGSRQPILAFKARPFENSDFKIWLNNREILSTDLDESHTRIYWEVISASTAFPEGASFNNPAPLRFILTSGRMRISDMVMWYQVDKPWD